MRNLLLDFYFLSILCLFQILLFNNVDFIKYKNFYIYTLFVLIYPIHGNKFRLLFLSFLLGSIIDNFMNSRGIHAFSLTFIAYIRFYILRFITGEYTLSYRYLLTCKLSFLKQFFFIFIMIFIHNQILLFFEYVQNYRIKERIFEIFLTLLLQVLFMLYIFSLLGKSDKN